MVKTVYYDQTYSDDGAEKELYDTRFSLFKVENDKIIFYNFIADKFFTIDRNDIVLATIKGFLKRVII